MRHISITEKLILYFLLLGIGAIMIIGYYSYNNARSALMTRTFDQLTTVRNVRKNQIENFFKDRIRDIDLISKSKDVHELLEEINQKSKFNIQNSIYNQYLNKYINSSGYYKTFCICNSSKEAAETNTATNDSAIRFTKLTESDTSINRLLTKIFSDKKIIIRDYTAGQPCLYIGAPVLSRERVVKGAVILEISGDAINSIMLESSPENGLGTSGESYLTGSDYLMRSTSRFITNSFLHTKVKTEGVLNAFKYGEGSSVIRDYRNIPVLSSYRKINVSELNWVILAEIDLAEAMIPIYSIRNNILFFMTIIGICLFIFAYVISKRITMPIIRLQEATNDIAKGNFDIEINRTTNDEIGDLTDSFNKMTKRLKRQTIELKEKDEMRLNFVIDGQEKERQRLSRELHDGLGQSLIAVKLMLENTEDADITKTRKIIDSAKTLFDNIINEVRRISDNLMPAVLDEFGLNNALRNLCDEVGELSGININFEAVNLPDKLNSRLIRYIYRIIQEAINNIVKHSNATKAEVNIKTSENLNNILLSVKDNGKGFLNNDINLKGSNGLNNMKERVNLLHGKINISSEQGKGTEISIEIPINNE
jgi:signal transduction histidine kinase